uniref:DDE-1 domain-containing protein n=1 Tax=Amphimedon queenslandica TaxID=400682 RepID=A0A1X7V2G6_AMPQE
LAHQNGHSVLWLLVGHCKLNLIELSWASVKGYVARNNTNYNLTSIQQLVQEGFLHTTPDMWQNFYQQVKKIEAQYIEKDGIIEETLDERVIKLGKIDRQ